MALLTTIAGSENVGLTKINAVINTVNEFGGGTIGQRLVKNSGNDFDTTWANPELKQLSTTSINLSTLSVGSGFIIDVPNCTYDVKSNIRLKCYSASTPTNYIIGLVYGVSGSLTVSITIEIISGTATVNDWVIIPYNYELSTFNLGQSGTFVANQLFSALALTNATFSSLIVSAFKRGNEVTLNGNIAITATANTPIVRFSLTDKYEFLNGNTVKYIFSSNALNNASGTYSNINSICNNISLGTPSSTLLSFSTFNTVANGNVINFYFSINYIAKNY